jgi:hypothetical protein
MHRAAEHAEARGRAMSKRKRIKKQLTRDEVERLLSPPCIEVPVAGQVLDLNRSAAYVAARRGDIETIRIGRLLKVPTAPLRKKLGI